MKAADGASAGRKPWRYYYVMAFPLGSNSDIIQDKLEEMTEMTTAIEHREEEYLRKVVARNAAHAKEKEAERRAAEGKKTPLVASHVAWLLRRLCLISAVLLLLIVVLMYALYVKGGGRDRVPQRFVHAATIFVVVMLVVNIGGWVAAYKCSVNGARMMFVVGVALIVGVVLLLDEVVIVRRSHEKLQEALGSRLESLTQDDINLIINGGTIPSLVQRFVLDAPSIFLQWLSVRCSRSQTMKLGYSSVAIDRRDFFSPFWDDRRKSCVNATLRRCIQFDEAVEPILLGELVMVSLQVFLTGLFLITCGPLVARKAAKRRKRVSLPKAAPTSAPSLSIMLRRMLILGATLFGTSSAIVSADLLYFCSIADFHALFTWIIMASLLSGLSSLLAALCIGCGWKRTLAGLLLAVAVASEVVMFAEFVKIADKLIWPNSTTKRDPVQIHKLRELYVNASSQTCSSIEHWISHVCVGMTSSNNAAAFDLSCQNELVALLLASFNFATSYLVWSIGVKLVLLMQLMLPALWQAVVNTVTYLRQAILDVASYLCCVSPPENDEMAKVKSTLQQPPNLDYKVARRMYVGSLRVRDRDRRKAERKAFKEEWSIRTGRKLPDLNEKIAASDFDAIVRSLVLRRLTAVCKLDVSLSVSDDGHLLLIRIFASDNLLLATLCETETYRLQFADAIDPGKHFWRNRKEVNADQTVLDSNTAKHKLKLLLVEKTMTPKEAAWFPGESLARVSARVHALSRISRASKGLIRCCNRAPAFASYSPSIQRQFIYQKYPNKLDIPETYRQSAVLRTVDCIRVTRRIINAEFNTSAMIAEGLISSFHCLHSSSRFDINSRGVLASSWVKFWRPVHLPGEFCPNEHAILNLISRIAPFRQPLQDVRDYFGEVVAYYFAWLAFYGKKMFYPALVAIIMLVIETKRSLLWVYYYISRHDEDIGKIGDTISLPELIFGLVVITWSVALVKSWERRSVWYQLQWGVTTSDADSLQNSYSYSGIVYKSSLCPNFQRQLGSWLAILVLGIANLLVVLMMILTQGVIAEIWGMKLAVLGSSTCQAFVMQWNGVCIPFVASALSRWETPRGSNDHPAYQSSVVAKIFFLHWCNTFTGLVLLMLSGVGGMALLVQVVTPLRSLYVSYRSRIEGHVGVFIQIQTLIVALFAVQLCIRIILILSTLGRLRSIQQEGRNYSRKEKEDETMLSPYPGPHKDYAQVVMQLGLVVMFSSVCPLVPLLALFDCAIKLRQNALELCCIRQRPEPDEVKMLGVDDEDDDVGLGLWAPYVRLMLKLSVSVALALAAFRAENFGSISLERRVGWWLIGVVGMLLVAEVSWGLIPRESRQAEEARARATFLVERYFGHAEVREQKSVSKEEKRTAQEDKSLHGPTPSAEESLQHYKERLDLLKRLTVAVRKKNKATGGLVSKGEVTQGTQVIPTSSDEDDVDNENDEEVFGDYFWSGKWPQQEKEGTNDTASPAIVKSTEEPPPQSASLDTPPVEETKIGESGDQDLSSSRTESRRGVPTERPPPMLLSKLFKRMSSEETNASLLSPNAEVDIDPGIFAPTEAVTVTNPEVFHDDEFLEEKREAPAEGAITAPNVEASERALLRQFSPRWSFLSRGSIVSEDSNVNLHGGNTGVPELPPPRRLSMLFRRAQPTPSQSTPPPQPPPPVVTNISAFERTEAEDRTVNPVPSLHGDAHEESTVMQTSMQRRRSRGSVARPISPLPVYRKIDLSGLEAVHEAASRQQFDFSADEQVWEE